MTDSSPLNTHTAPLVRTLSGSLPTSIKAGLVLDSEPVLRDEVEDYTIKCICGFQEDDGNTIYCDRCETWQHTQCYYIDKHGFVPTSDDLDSIDHFCADCQPRPLDAKGAIERQRNRREEPEPGEQKVKKTATKSHKKKIRVPNPNVVLTNGWAHGSDPDVSYDRTSRSPLDPVPPMKRPKASHRLSNSTHLPTLHPNLTSQSHKRSGSNVQSPSKSRSKYSPNRYAGEPYSVEFLCLYDNDPGDSQMRTNLLNDIEITKDLSLWSHDVESLREASHGLSPQDVFTRCDQPIDTMPLPEITKKSKQDVSFVVSGRHPSWIYLTVDAFMPKDSMVSELKGKVGHMNNYIQDPASRWDYLRHPAPFVFFHSKLPIYIDTRSEGTLCRYLRRSCNPNLSMKTFLENGSDYHFCFVAKQDLDAGSELTIGWCLDEHVRNFFYHRNNEGLKQEGDGLVDEEYVTDWVGKVLADFGGCACNSPNTCAFARYDRRSTSLLKGRNGASGKTSPSNAGSATNSREDSEQDDRRSSSRSHSQSRDMTPTHNATGESGFGAGLEISDREKRKIAALEKNFEQLENDKQQPVHKKKKRNSGGSNVNATSAVTSRQLGPTVPCFSQSNTPGMPLKAQHVDPSVSRRKSGSPTAKSSNAPGRPRSFTISNLKKRSSQPNTPSVPSPLIRQNYVNCSMQTEPDENDWYESPAAPAPAKRHYMSLTKQLLLRSQRDHKRLEEQRRLLQKMPTSSQTQQHIVHISESFFASPVHEETCMQDAGSVEPDTARCNRTECGAHKPWAAHPIENTLNGTSAADIKPPPPWPSSHAMHLASEQSRPANGFRPNDLRVQLPQQPTVLPDSASSAVVDTPTSTVAHSPFSQNPSNYPPPFTSSSSNLVQPSPVKKKLSLGDYMSRRKGSHSITEKPTSNSPIMQHGTLKAVGSLSRESTGTSMNVGPVTDTAEKEAILPSAAKSKDPKL